jgi:DNA repair protein RecN (Recombination protein N)
MEAGGERLIELERAFSEARTRYLDAAEGLSSARRRVAGELPTRIESLLTELAMERTRFDVRFGPAIPEEAWTAEGLDRLEFYVSPNPGEELRPLARTASGGELSRIMLAIRTLSATTRTGYSEAGERPPSASAPGLIFDEVDAGIGGRAADAVGRKLRALGSAFQVLCITHLPQIAAYADTQFVIEKRVDDGRTRTVISRVKDSARIDELSRMLGGAVVTDAVRASAREMLAKRLGADLKAPRPRAKAKGESESRRAK